MGIFRRRFRDWWQPPRRAGDRPEHRQVTFLELFYDLVYVVLIAQLSHSLAEHFRWSGAAGFAFLFIIVWWAWFNGSTYHDLHGNNDIRTRLFTFLQMFSVVAMAVFAHDALGESSSGFALSYAAFQLTLTYLWWRTGVYDPDHRPLSRPYTISFLITTALFVVSVFVPMSWRFTLWGAALVISLLMPALMFFQGKNNPTVQAQIDIVTTISPSLVERFGLFTIIVLGEVIVGVVSGVSENHPLTWSVGLAGVLGTLVAIGLWWLYFDSVSHHLPLPGATMVSAWFYLHLPLAMGISAVGAAVFNFLAHAGAPLTAEARWLFVGAVGAAMVSIAALTRTVQLTPVEKRTLRKGRRVILVSAVLVLLLGFLELGATALLASSIVLLLTPLFSAIRVWLTSFDDPASDRANPE